MVDRSDYQFEFIFEDDPEQFVAVFVEKMLHGMPECERNLVDMERFKAELSELFFLNDLERKKQGIEKLTDTQKYLILYFFYKTAVLFSDKKRHTGEPYFFGHLMDTVKLGINTQGKVGMESMLSRVLHDLIEDVKEKKPEYKEYSVDQFWGLFFEDSILREIIQNYSFEEAGRINESVRRAVEAVTKIKVPEDRALTNDLSFFILLREIYNDLRAVSVKIDDRASNSASFSVFEPSKKRKLIDETLELYLPLAQILKKSKSAEVLFKNCMEDRNPKFLDDFGEKQDKRMSKLNKMRFKLKDALMSIPNVVSVDIVPKSPLDYLPEDVDLENVTFDDLNVSPADLMSEVVIQVKPFSTRDNGMGDQRHDKFTEKQFQRERMFYLDGIAGNILHEMKRIGSGIPVESRLCIPSSGFAMWKGLSGYVVNEALGGKVNIRVNDTFHEARSKRGLEVFGFRPTAEIRGQIDFLLNSVKTDESGSPVLSSVRGLIKRAREVLLMPRITVYTVQGKPMEMLQGATLLDFARMVHRDFLLGIQYGYKWPAGGGEMEKVAFNERLVDGAHYFVENCLKKTNPNPENIQVDPTWLLWCKSQEARHVVRRYLRGDYKDFPVSIDDAVAKGEEYIYSLYSLLGDFDLLEKFEGVLMGDDVVEDFYYKVGVGEENLLEKFVSMVDLETVSDREWLLEVELPDESGALKTFINMLVKSLNVDIRGNRMDFTEKKMVSGDTKIKLVKINIKTGEGLSVFDFFKELLKFQSNGYELRIMNKFGLSGKRFHFEG